MRDGEKLIVRCEICGVHGADSLCIICGKVVCDRCFHGFGEICRDCVPKSITLKTSRGRFVSSLRWMGVLFLIVGLLVTSMAFVQGNAEGLIVIFPFVIGDINGWLAVALTLASISLFITTSFLPWIIFNRERWIEKRRTFWEVSAPGQERTDYMITVDLPKGLEKTIFIEERENVIHLKSSTDNSFHRSYSLPVGFEVDEYRYEYQENYLLIILSLMRESGYPYG